MSWIKTQEGYIRQDAIIDIHISPYYPKTILFGLISGEIVKFQDFKDEGSAAFALGKIIKELDKEA